MQTQKEEDPSEEPLPNIEKWDPPLKQNVLPWSAPPKESLVTTDILKYRVHLAFHISSWQ
jgi:hypothetical protein